MFIFKCKMCGGVLEINKDDSIAICDSCGTKQTLPRLDDEKRANLYSRANHYRRNNEYDKARDIYEKILEEDQTDAEAYWSLVLCKYGIEYVEDPLTHKRMPTVNRMQYTSVFADEDYKEAIKNADGYQKSVYEEEAKAIDKIQRGILEISNNEEPFDVFICYKETGNDGRRTPDSVLAMDLYKELTREGFRTFFSRITLEDKLGTAYEPYIFAALNSAKVMVVVGTKPEYFNAVWVRNEWSRFIALIQSGERKSLIPAYRDMDPYDLPKELSHLQSQDMSKPGCMQDLVHAIHKITEHEKANATKESTVNQNAANASSLLKRAFIFLSDENWTSANKYFEMVLDIEPECARAYLGKFMLKHQIKSEESIGKRPKIYDKNDANLKKAILYSSEKEKNTILALINSAEEEYKRVDHAIHRLLNGEQTDDSNEEKFKFCEIAAKNGNPAAQYLVAKCYDLGLGVKVDKKSAYLNYVNSAGVKSDVQPLAAYMAGTHLCNGSGVQKDVKRGVEYIKAAAKDNYAPAYKLLGDICFFGYYGYKKDLSYAIEMYEKAISCEGDSVSDVYLNLSRCYQQNKDYNKAIEILHHGDQKGRGDCQNEIGVFYENGISVAVDKQQAFSWYKKSAENDYGMGLFNLARFYEFGIAVESDYDTAMKLYIKAAKKDVPMACYKCGLYAFNRKEYNSAKVYYEKAAAHNILLAYNELGLLYEYGVIGNSKGRENLKIALQYYLKGANAGIVNSQYNAGRLFQVEFQDYNKALYWYKIAAEQGHGDALKAYGMLKKLLK